MSALLDVVLPVFVVIGAGYAVVWLGWFNAASVEGLLRFTQNFAIPCLLFTAISQLDLGQSFNAPLLISFYAGALAGFGIGTMAARLVFGRDWPEAIAIGFCCLFSNTVLLGLPITERAYGAGALSANFAIIALHSPVCYAVGITAMEIARAGGTSRRAVLGKVLKAMFSNALIIGIGLGFIVNLTGLAVPDTLGEGLELIARAALPAALFGLGGVLVQYRPEGDLRVIAMVVAVSLVVHPAITMALARVQALPVDALRSAVITGAMAPGINTYIFANMYGVARRVAASAVLIGTALSILTAWLWLGLLP
ncbi:AEC family transporter [Pelagivirga sediminicola]|uniref:AEC family transporter n=1 Tax=Pelagivirga sediminicola TaxID=2170575 RepID=A0A2T7G417_9RHOB|nr:AEC family transporter [Pelagivirga sediminicola]PVA09174.1 AEC family transporter [Pelagivirga sediminicola]